MSTVGPEIYDKLGERYVIANSTSAYNAYHERPSAWSLVPPVVKGLRALDLGCGPGVNALELVNRGAAVTAVDGSRVMLAHAEERLKGRAVLLHANFEFPLPFAANSFDLILSTLTLHYVRDIDRLSRELFGLLSPGGKLVLSTEHPGTSYGNPPEGNYFGCLPRTEEWMLAGEASRVSVYRRPLSEMVRPFLESGFQLEALSEGILTDRLKQDFPDLYALFLKAPPFLFFRWGKPE